MNAKRARTFLLAPVAALILTGGCQRVPKESVEAATSALEAAKSAGAETYVKEAYAKAETMLEKATAEIDAQNGRSMFSRSYTEAASLLTRAKESADEARVLAEKKREEWKREAETLISDAQVALGSARDFVAKSKSAKRAALGATLERAGAGLVESEKAFESEHYVDAHSKAEEADALIDEVMEELGAAPRETKRQG